MRAARDALRQLLAAHPDHCSGITIENDLAVMLHALGELAEAETMARRSLQSWKGVAHTETLSLLVLGAVLTSAGRHAEADAALGRALALAREQASPGFEAEAQVRRARLLLQCGRYALARQALDAAAPLLAASAEPLRVSQYTATQWLVASAAGQPPDPALHGRLHAIGSRSAHPWVQLRLVRVDIEQALAGADAARAAASAERMAAIARDAGLLEALAEALLLRVRAGHLLGEAAATLRAPALEAQTLAAAQGLADAAWRAAGWLDAIDGRHAESTATRAARRVLLGPTRPALFDAAAAARREPGVTAPAPGRAPIPRTRGADSGG